MTITLHTGDALTELRKLAGASVHCCITSPPYLGLRDYRVEGMIGLEPTWAEHLAALLGILDVEMRRVLRPDGLLIVNYGDKYVAGGGDYGLGLPDKCRMALPERLLIAMIDRGWIYRAKSPWVKRNGLPDSAGDRLGANLEDIYLFAHPESRGRYFWDAEAVRLEYAPATVARYDQAERMGDKAIDWAPPGQSKTGIRRETSHLGRSRRMGDAWVESIRALVGDGQDDQLDERIARLEAQIDAEVAAERRVPGRLRFTLAELREERAARSSRGGLVLNEAGEPLGLYESTQGFNGAKLLADFVESGKPYMRDGACPHHGKNGARTFRGDCTCTPVSEDHYATFPESLVEPFIKAATSERGCCPACGAPWERVVENPRVPDEIRNRAEDTKMAFHTRQTGSGQKMQNWRDENPPQTTGWRPTCECEACREQSGYPMPAELEPCTVLDPFAGAGTTLLVADRLGRHAVGIELNPAYVAMAKKRLAKDAPLFHGEGA